MVQNYEKEANWVHNKWRPAMGWSYMAVCVFDFMIAPIFFIMVQVIFGVDVNSIKSWTPMTLAGGGLYHISMLTIVGVTAYGRTKEKMQQVVANIQGAGDILFPEPVPVQVNNAAPSQVKNVDNDDISKTSKPKTKVTRKRRIRKKTTTEKAG